MDTFREVWGLWVFLSKSLKLKPQLLLFQNMETTTYLTRLLGRIKRDVLPSGFSTVFLWNEPSRITFVVILKYSAQSSEV